MTDKSEKEEERQITPSQIKIVPGRPIELLETSQHPPADVSDDRRKIMSRVGDVMRAYLAAAKDLLEGQYSNLRDLAPRHLSDPGAVWVSCCEEAVLIRYDSQGEHRLYVGWSPENLLQLAPKFSENVVNCYADKNFKSMIPKTGPKIELKAFSSATEKERTLLSIRIGFDVVLESPPQPLPAPPRKPYCLVSVRNSLEIATVGETIPEGSAPPKRFLTRTPLRLPVGWDSIEIFPFFDSDHWKPEYANIWAENDILAAVVAHQLREKKYQTLDPNAAARKEFSRLLDSYKKLLDSDPDREEILQKFLKKNPVLLCPAHRSVWPKLPFGAKESDFVFQEAVGEYLLVELELPSCRLFLKNGDTSGDLKHAQNQILDWKRYIEDNLFTVQRELGLNGISSNPKSLIVIGRSHSLTTKERRKLATIENESPKTKIMTYDDVLKNAKAIGENLFGPFWGEMGSTEVYYLSG